MIVCPIVGAHTAPGAEPLLRQTNAPCRPASRPLRRPPIPSSPPTAAAPARNAPQFAVLGGISFAHMLNDMIQSLILAIYPILKNDFHLSFAQIGLITLTYQLTASLLQPLVGMVTDRRPMPYSLPVGMGFTLCRLAAAGGGAELPGAAARRGAGRHRLVGVPSGVLAGGADGLRRTARPGAVAVPGRRQRRLVAGAAAGRLDHRAARARQRGVVLAGRAAGDRGAAAGRPLVRPAPRRARQVGGAASDRSCRCRATRSSARWRSSAC